MNGPVQTFLWGLGRVLWVRIVCCILSLFFVVVVCSEGQSIRAYQQRTKERATFRIQFGLSLKRGPADRLNELAAWQTQRLRDWHANGLNVCGLACFSVSVSHLIVFCYLQSHTHYMHILFYRSCSFPLRNMKSVAYISGLTCFQFVLPVVLLFPSVVVVVAAVVMHAIALWPYFNN